MKREQDPDARLTAQPRSVSFWLSMFVALLLYGLAVLSPRLATREKLLSEYHSEHVRLRRDEQKLNRLQLVSASLKQDSRFIEDLLRKDQKSKRQGEEIIPLEGELVYGEEEAGRGGVPRLPIRTAPWYAPVISAIGHSSDIRGVLLLSSAALILLAFGFLQSPDPGNRGEGQGDREEIQRSSRLASKWLSRYAQSSDEREKRKLLERFAQRDATADWKQDALPVETIDDDGEG